MRRRLVWQLLPDFVLILLFVAGASIVASGIYSGVILSALLSIIFLTGVVFFFRSVSRKVKPLEDLAASADRLLKGRHDVELPSEAYDVGVDLFSKFGEIARGLESRIRTVLRQRSEQEAVFSCLLEGVVALNLEGKILKMNDAAGRLLAFSPFAAKGRSLEEVFRSIELQKFARSSIDSRVPSETSLTILHDQERYVDVYSKALKDVDGLDFGILLVFHDVTRLKHLEMVRRDFIANVSHELKTPVTAIRGFVETLLDGALSSPKDSEKFLNIIARQAERLHSIFEDLLSLARLEEAPGKMTIEREEVLLREVLERASQCCEPKISDKKINFALDCDSSVKVKLNSSLIEQAVINLISNAITYSDAGGDVRVEAVVEGPITTIKVKDKGCGIERSQLPRIFERFYRVDPGRSRKQGGTGLGLSIVKHIAQVHRGDVQVESVIGKGSTFSFTIQSSEG